MHAVQQSQWLVDIIPPDVEELGAPILEVLPEHFREQADVLRKLAMDFLTRLEARKKKQH